MYRCYGYHSGNIPFTADDGLTAQCLTQTHAKENKVCISTQGSSCDSGKSQNVGSVLESRLYGDHKLDQDSSLAIQAAIGAAVGNGLKWSDDTRFGPGYISFGSVSLSAGHKWYANIWELVHVADNGSSIRGVEVFKKNLCKK